MRKRSVACLTAIALSVASLRAWADPKPPVTATTDTAPTPPPAPPAPPAAGVPPADAATALERARAAYEYGDMEMVVDSARLVAEGRLRPTPAQRAQALRYLGIGLFLTGRPEGAETAFFDLLRLRASARLDPTTTRPDVVAFFEDVRRRHADEIRQAARDRPGRSFALAFLPPIGQFQNGHRARGFTIGALEALSLGTAIVTKVQLSSWAGRDQTFPGHMDDARTLKPLNNISVAVLVLTVIIGIVDGVANFDSDSDEPRTARLDGGALGFRF